MKKKATGGSQWRGVDGLTHYQANKAYYLKRVKARKREAQAFVLSIKKQGKCVDCGFNDFRALDFDHVRGRKRTGVSNLCLRGASEETLLKEIAKCDIRCANCHRVRHFK